MRDPSPPRLVVHPVVRLEWTGGTQFVAGRPGGPSIRIDGDGREAPSPFDAFLGAMAACAATDVVSILEKGRTPVQSLAVQIEAQRVDGTPRRLAAATFHFTIRAQGATRRQAERAIELAVTKYCSVRSSLADDVTVGWTLDL